MVCLQLHLYVNKVRDISSQSIAVCNLEVIWVGRIWLKSTATILSHRAKDCKTLSPQNSPNREWNPDLSMTELYTPTYFKNRSRIEKILKIVEKFATA